MSGETTTHNPEAAAPLTNMGGLTLSTINVNDVQGCGGVFSVDDGKVRALDLVANSTAGSAVTLSTWNKTAAAVVPVVRVTASGVAIGQPVTAGAATFAALKANSVTDGALTGAISVAATTLTDGVASLTAGSLSGVKNIQMSGVFSAANLATPLMDIVPDGDRYFGGAARVNSWRGVPALEPDQPHNPWHGRCEVA